MAKAVQKITLSPSRDVPFNKLVLSQSNVRRVKAGISIEQLAESIAQRTLLQSLNVRAVVDADGNETGTFEVPAGGRRYRALELLVKQKRMAKMQLVPCVVREGGIAEDDSIAENDERVGLHPLDQFRAFQTLRTLGMSEEDIAARHFVSPAVVKQRLRLASVSPKLHEVYAEDGMTLEQLMAFSVTADHARQEQVWENVSKSGYDEPYQIRRMLTEDTVRASDKRAQFVGIAAYEAAGGGILRDLFERDDGGWLTAHRTLALRDAVATNHQVAMTALLHKLCLDAFQREMPNGCLQVSVRQVHFSAQASDLKESASAKAIDDRNKAWAADMPNDEVALWDWLAALDDASRSALLAHCVSFGVNALFEKADRYGGNGVSSHGLRQRFDQADRLARAVNLDMVGAGWRPSVDNYLGRVTKSRILEAVREAKGESSVQLIDHLKKNEMAKEAERLLDGTGWLPEPLRLAEFASASSEPEVASEPLPEFLADDEDDVSEASEDEEPHAVAAE